MTLAPIEIIEHAIGLVRLSQPDRLNVLSRQLIVDLNVSLDSLEKNPDIKCIILTGDGKAFCAGADLQELQSETADSLLADDFIEPWQRLAACEKPVIAAINGAAVGGGCELALMADMIVASDKACFGQPEIMLGLIPGGGGTQRLPRVIGKAKSMELCLTGKIISAQDALSYGLVNYVVAGDALLPTAIGIAQKIVCHPLPTIKYIKQAIKNSEDMPLQQGLDFERKLFQIDFSLDAAKDGIDAFLHKRHPSK
ncbi:MAG: enoyl-CoA hydratase-related protein [Alphaproteobacteria bacterium]|nr:enoyl-CoA hydratase-related protein [Alphaproteobacteria bacterium]